MLWLFRLISGYVVIKISGESVEELLNSAAKCGINLWKLRCRKNYITGCVSISGFRELRKIRKNKKIKIHILKKIGFPFFTAKYKKRLGLFAGMAIFFAILKLMSGFVWIINVEGNKTVSSDSIIKICNDLGIHESVPKSRIDCSDSAQKLVLNCKNLAWASLNIEGCVLTVEVTESVNPKDDNAEVPNNIKASFDGKIERMDIVSGTTLVKVGDVVKKGDLLVSGIIERLNSTLFVRSSGTVTARTEHTIEISEKLADKKNVYTGKVKKHRVLHIFGQNIPLYLGKIRGDYYIKLNHTDLKLFSKKIPIGYTEKICYIIDKKMVVKDRKTVIFELTKEIDKEIKKIGAITVEKCEPEIIEKEGKITIRQKVICTENIAEKEKILVDVKN